MPRTELIKDNNANVNYFKYFNIPSSIFSIDFKISDIVSGSPTYTILVSNVPSGEESDYKEYNTATTNVAITQAIEFENVPFEFMAVRFNSNGSTGKYSFYIFNL